MVEISNVPIYLVTAPGPGRTAPDDINKLTTVEHGIMRDTAETLRLAHGLGNGAVVLASRQTSETGKIVADALPDSQLLISEALGELEVAPLRPEDGLDGVLDSELGGYQPAGIVVALRRDLVRAALRPDEPPLAPVPEQLNTGAISPYARGTWVDPFALEAARYRQGINGHAPLRTLAEVVEKYGLWETNRA